MRTIGARTDSRRRAAHSPLSVHQFSPSLDKTIDDQIAVSDDDHTLSHCSSFSPIAVGCHINKRCWRWRRRASARAAYRSTLLTRPTRTSSRCSSPSSSSFSSHCWRSRIIPSVCGPTREYHPRVRPVVQLSRNQSVGSPDTSSVLNWFDANSVVPA
ncbi:hypothetical protein PHBOTO_006618 [Pseudozyma hubeiensis]|nr:hypothetical protein PHBOTO_006618 [Pseudozyma hubeiensis]